MTVAESAGFGTRPLALGVGRVTSKWAAFVGIAALIVLFAVYQYSRQLSGGLIRTGMRDPGLSGAAWGMYIAFDVYFVGVSFAGITMAALIRLLDLRRLRPVARMAEVLTVASLSLAGLATLADLGLPLRGIVNLLRYARPQSPFFGTFALVIAGYMFASLVYLFLDGRRDAARMAESPGRLRGFFRAWASGYHDTAEERQRHSLTTFWLAVAIIPLLITAHSTLGFVFGLQVGRPGWYSALQAPAFVVLAGASGLGLLMVLAAVVRRALHQQALLNGEMFATLGRFTMVLLIVYVYFMVAEMLTASYAGGEGERSVTDAVLRGEYAWVYWSSAALLMLSLAASLWQAFSRRWNVGLLVAIGIAVNLAAIGKRFVIVVPSQTKGALLPYDASSYTPSSIELSVILGLFALGALIIALFMKVFPIVELEDETGDEEVVHA